MGGASELIFLSKTIPKIVKIFRPAAPKWGRRPSFDLRRAPQAGSGGAEAFLGENCPNPRDLSATSPAPEAFLGVPQHVIFASEVNWGLWGGLLSARDPGNQGGVTVTYTGAPGSNGGL